MALIPDISAILSQALDDEDARYAEAVIQAIASDEAVVPTLFWFELRNALLIGERRSRLTPDRTTAFLADLALLPFAVDESPRETVVLDLARRHSLTVYDAAYLELAQRKNLPLATLDTALIKAAAKCGVKIFQRRAK
jgi:predicted nucleic acid-binding protein